MDWQEYQEAVARFYEQLGGIGIVKRNVFIPDKDTDRRRQIDVLIEVQAKGHCLKIMVDAKYRNSRIDVKDVEEVIGLANAVGACKGVIVTANGWTAPAERKANASNVDLRILTLEKALDLLVPEKWAMCPNCYADCIVLDHEGAMELDGVWLWWLAGQCRNCRFGFAWCQDCGEYLHIPVGEEVHCLCRHWWGIRQGGMYLVLAGSRVQFKI